MGQTEKSDYYQALKAAGAEFGKPFRNYTVAELKASYDQAVAQGVIDPNRPAQAPEPEPSIKLPVAHRDPEEMAGARQNTKAPDEPIRVDPDTGFIWFQEEVQKKGYAAPRGRRVLKYNDPGTREETVVDGKFRETFEVGGDRSIPSEVKITLPSYQVGIYKDPRHPFKTHVYNGNVGFDLFEVENYYGGADMIPEDVKRVYVGSSLCYDIRTVVRNIETTYRQLHLAGKV